LSSIRRRKSRASPSDATEILLRVRRFGLGLQLALLVSCGVASGYAWRAALGPGHDLQTRYIYGGKPFAPSWFSSPPSARVVPAGPAPTSRHSKLRRATSAGAAPASSSGTTSKSESPQLASVTPSPPAANSSPTPDSSPRPKGPGHPRHHSPHPPPPAPPQPPASPPSPPPAPPPSPPAPPAVAPTPPSVSIVQTAADKGSRPGWGHGDPNHDHTGPRGKGPEPEAPPSAAPTSDDQSKGKGRSK
jgi:hypothetical protein